MDKIDYNDELQKYYDSIKEGASLKYFVRFKDMGDMDTIDTLLDDLKGKTITVPPPPIKEDDEIAEFMKRKLEERRALERSGKIKIKI